MDDRQPTYLIIKKKKKLYPRIYQKQHTIHYEKKGCFATRLATQFLSCIRHLQFRVFICCECYWTSCKSCKSCNSLYIWCNSPYIRCNSLQFNYNFVATTPFQLLCNSHMTTIIMLCRCHFSSIHQNFTHGTMMIFCDFFEILIFIVHYDYSF